MDKYKELEAFKEWEHVHHVPPSVGKLWYALLTINATCEWKKRFNAPSKLVQKKSGLAKQTVSVARQKLVEHGLIVYEMGCRGKAPVYQLISFADEEGEADRMSSTLVMDQSMEASLIVDQSMDKSKNTVPITWINSEKRAYTSQPVDQSIKRDGISPQTWTVLEEEEEEERRRGGGTRVLDPFKIYEENFGRLRPILVESFCAWCEEFGDEMVIEAIKLTAEKGGQTYSYLDKILTQWKSAKLTTLDHVREYEQQKMAAKTVNISSNRLSKPSTSVFDKFRKGATGMTTEEAIDLLETISELYPKFVVTEKKIAFLIPELTKMDYNRVMQKLACYITEYPFPPTIADIAAYPPEENTYLDLMKQWQQEAALVSAEMKRQFTEQFDQLLKGVKRS